MRKLATAIFFILLVSPAWASSYFLAPATGGGNDSNNGTSASTPWLTPNHSVSCGDTITAAASSSYDQTNFEYGKWGTVTCSPGAMASVAWLKCATFDACKLSARNQNGMWVTSSYWGVQGWEVTASGGQAICFAAFPPTSGANIHHIIFANDIANGCYGAGFQAVNDGTAGVDYFVLVADIAYNAAQQSIQCGSGIAITGPGQTDSLPGTHIFVSQTFTWNNSDPKPCAGGTPTDGEGIIFDTFNLTSYAAQAVMENNIAFLNGSHGFEVWSNTSAPIYLEHNTAFGNDVSSTLNATICGDITLGIASNVHVLYNIARTNEVNGCGSNPDYAFYVADGDSTDIVDFNFGYGLNGQNSGSGGGSGFSYGTNNAFGTDPNFLGAPAINPGAPSCGSSSSVINCMAKIIADFIPKTSEAVGIGYQSVQSNSVTDPLFPQWLCNTNLPAGLVTMGCQSRPQPPPMLTVIGVT